MVRGLCHSISALALLWCEVCVVERLDKYLYRCALRADAGLGEQKEGEPKGGGRGGGHRETT